MGIFDKLFKKEEKYYLPEINVDDETIVAMADGEMIDVHTVSDPVFAEEMMGKSTAFKYKGDKVTICSPANGTLAVLFPTGHAFGVLMNNGVELLVHIGVDTVNSNGDGFKVLGKKQGETVKAGEPVVEIELKKLSQKYDMPVMLIVTNANDREIEFIEPQTVTRGQIINK